MTDNRKILDRAIKTLSEREVAEAKARQALERATGYLDECKARLQTFDRLQISKVENDAASLLAAFQAGASQPAAASISADDVEHEAGRQHAARLHQAAEQAHYVLTEALQQAVAARELAVAARESAIDAVKRDDADGIAKRMAENHAKLCQDQLLLLGPLWGRTSVTRPATATLSLHALEWARKEIGRENKGVHDEYGRATSGVWADYTKKKKKNATAQLNEATNDFR